ncbi:unnamed protein product [Trichobilharzia szidati]|nr:unnamed protein product [Trichobilharzia szidati]
MLVKSDKSNEDNGRYFEEMNRNEFWGWNEDYETLLHFSESFDGMANRSEIDWKLAESQMNETKNYLLGKLKRRTLLDKFVECSTQNSEILYRLRLYAGNFIKVMKPHIKFVRTEIAKLRVEQNALTHSPCIEPTRLQKGFRKLRRLISNVSVWRSRYFQFSLLSGVFREMADAISKVEVENNRIQYPMIQQQ